MQKEPGIYFKYIMETCLLIAGLFFVYLMIQVTLPYLSLRYDIGFLLTKQPVLHLASWRVSFYIHITTSIVVLLAGFFQFVKPILLSLPRVHRILGKVYVVLVLVCCAPSGFVMALYANGGFWAKLSFAITSVLWWAFTWQAYRKISKGNSKEHKAYMYRSFALTLSAITLRIFVWILPAFSYIHHLHGKEMYIWVAWLSWLPNLFIAEWLIRKK